MGQASSDYYQKQDLSSSFSRKDQQDSQYIWLDLRISGQENKIYLDRFKNEFKVVGEGKIQNFKEYVRGYSNRATKLRVICAASLPEDVYAFIQNSQNIQRSLLFCGNKIRASNLMRDYSKIAKACYSYIEVIRQVKLWEKQPFASFHFYQPQEIQKLNRFNANILSLKDSQNIAQESLEHSIAYLTRFLPNDLITVGKFKEDFTKARDSPEAMLAFIRDSLLANYSKIFNEVNYLLKATTNPKKLAHLRCIINSLFNSISDHYSKSQLQQSTYYTVIDINEQESKRILGKDQYFINSFFLSAEVIAPSEHLQLKDNEIKLIIMTPSKPSKLSQSNGFFFYMKKTIFNPGCYFKLESYDEASRSLTVRLMSLRPDPLKGKEQAMYLNRQWLERLQKKYDGQWLALLLSDPASASQYINLKMEAINKEKQKKGNPEQSKFKWALYNEQWSLMSNKLSNIENAISNIKPYDDSSKFQLDLIACDLLLLEKKQSRLRAQIKKLPNRPKKSISRQSQLKIKIYLAYDKYLGASSDPKALKTCLEELSELQQALEKQQCFELSAAYFLLLTVKMRCLWQLGSFNEELLVIDKMLKINSICSGRSSPQCLRLNRLKVEVISMMNKEVNDLEAARKARLLSTCKVKLDDLRDPAYDCVYLVNSSKINLALYD